MRRPPRTIRETVAGRPIEVPVYGDEETTREIVERVNERLKEIEDTSGGRVDTHLFALRAAISFAAELQEAEDQLARQEREVLGAASDVLKALRAAVDAARTEPDPEPGPTR